ncbi:hypothetical protein SAMN04489798_4169 [Pseudomonas arsenicoxydans]|uniref:Uncharacterized protein n=1 Tax=Pseudomonas arsenicoxydans TaxID=702115 RepID=A0A1H0NC53_9PSED|nr:hypothetical protein SAMN04489798_4169 [Pseudomonas arsenicoxydans]
MSDRFRGQARSHRDPRVCPGNLLMDCWCGNSCDGYKPLNARNDGPLKLGMDPAIPPWHSLPFQGADP